MSRNSIDFRSVIFWSRPWLGWSLPRDLRKLDNPWLWIRITKIENVLIFQFKTQQNSNVPRAWTTSVIEKLSSPSVSFWQNLIENIWKYDGNIFKPLYGWWSRASDCCTAEGWSPRASLLLLELPWARSGRLQTKWRVPPPVLSEQYSWWPWTPGRNGKCRINRRDKIGFYCLLIYESFFLDCFILWFTVWGRVSREGDIKMISILFHSQHAVSHVIVAQLGE